jgi:hypothetical protein
MDISALGCFSGVRVRPQRSERPVSMGFSLPEPAFASGLVSREVKRAGSVTSQSNALPERDRASGEAASGAPRQ